MMVWMWDGLNYQILMFTRESCLAAHTIRVVLEYGLLTSRYTSVCLCFQVWTYMLSILFISSFLALVMFIPFKQRIEPSSVGNAKKLNGHSESKSTATGNLSVLSENTSKASLSRLPVSQSSDPIAKETKTLGRLSVSQNSDVVKEPKVLACM